MIFGRNRTRSDILYKYRPSFVEGAARAFDIFGHMPVRECRDSSPEAVAAALAGDWETIGADLRNAMLDFESEHGIEVLENMEQIGVAGDPKAS